MTGSIRASKPLKKPRWLSTEDPHRSRRPKADPGPMEALSSKEMWFSTRTSVVSATMSTAICMTLAIPAAYALTRTAMPLKRASEVLLELTLCLPYIVLGQEYDAEVAAFMGGIGS